MPSKREESPAEDSERLLQDDELNESCEETGTQRIRWKRAGPRVYSVLITFLAIMGIAFGGIIVFGKSESTVSGSNFAVGQDYAGKFVPQNVYERPQLVATSESIYEISAATFQSTSILNQTIMLWNTLAPGASFVKSSETEWHGNEMPLEMPTLGRVFQITALHQMHCLTTILRDYSLLLLGFKPDQLYDDRELSSIQGHSAHCFNEIRRAVMCLADSTSVGHGENIRKAESSGKLHVCNNYDALLEWANNPVRKLPEKIRGGYA